MGFENMSRINMYEMLRIRMLAVSVTVINTINISGVSLLRY